jgi:tetratricopeptide (TPR) repeat protein
MDDRAIVEPRIEPELSPEQREELGHIAYLLAELESLAGRGLVAAATLDAVVAEKSARRGEIERQGRAAGALKQAQRLAAKSPREALTWAGHARRLAPEAIGPWSLAVHLLGQLGDYEAAVALCREAADLHGHDALRGHLSGLEAERRRREQARAVAADLESARRAVESGRFEEAAGACERVLAAEPTHAEALRLSVDAYERLGRFAEAIDHCERLRRARPGKRAGYSEGRLQSLRERLNSEGRDKPLPDPEVRWLDAGAPAPPAEVGPPVPKPVAPALRWGAVVAEVLEDHWQKLILSLAVLLIVVSSTVGAAIVLGDRLWRAEGKCLLALAYTALFAGFGRGLWQWGAERAGRIMCLTTLIVLPVNFALAGELPALGRSPSVSLAVLAIDVVALVALGWWLCRVLGLPGGAQTPAMLLSLGALDALTPCSVPFAWGFAAMLGAAGLYVAAVERLDSWVARRRVPDKADGDDPLYFALGLLTFYFLGTVARVGGYVLHLPPSLYAVPVIVAAVAGVRVAEGLARLGRDRRPVAFLRFAAFVLSAVAFAMALARPPGPSALFSGNTLATALIGLYLYVRCLCLERRPAYLYAGFAALFLAYFGASDLLGGLTATIEAAVSRALGYPGRLPQAFKALNGLVFNAALAGLSLYFARRWGDRRLARHCHAIGLPLSIAACVLSASEPTAAVLTLTGYAVLYAAAARLFAAPRVVYLACAAFAGASAEAATFLGDLTGGARAMALAAIALTFWAVARVLALRGVALDYRRPVIRSARAVSAVALVLAAYAALPPRPATWTAMSAFWILAALYVLIGLEAPRLTVAYAATACGAVALLLTTRVVTHRVGLPIGEAWFAAKAAALGALFSAASPALRRLADHREARLGRPSRAALYAEPLAALGLILAALGVTLAAFQVADGLVTTPIRLAGVAATLASVAVALVFASAASEGAGWLAYPASLSGSCGAVAAALAGSWAAGRGPSPAILSALCGGLALILAGLGERLRGVATGWTAHYRRPLLAMTLLAVGLTWSSGLGAGDDLRLLTIALALAAVGLAAVTRQTSAAPVPHLALAGGMAAWLCAATLANGGRLPALSIVGLLVLAFVLALLAAREAVRLVAPAGGAPEVTPTLPTARRAFGAALPWFAPLATLAALALALADLPAGAFAAITADLMLGAVVFLWLTRLRREAGLVHIGLVAAWLASLSGCLWALGVRDFAGAPGIDAGWLALTTAAVGLAPCLLIGWGRRWEVDRYYLDPLRDVGMLLAAATFLMVAFARAETYAAYPTCVAALLLLVATLVAWAALERDPWRTGGAIVAFVVAAYLTLFELGRGRAGHVSALGVLASLLAVLSWGIDRAVRGRLREPWHPVFARPLLAATLILATLALPPDWGAPGPLLLAALPFLLVVKSLPAAEWLYAVLAIVAASATFAIVRGPGFDALIPAAVVGAFACWALGLLVRRAKPAACDRLGLPALGYEFPPFHMAAALGLAAMALRADAVLRLGQAWSGSAWLPLALAALSLLMLVPHPHRGWVDGFVALASFGVLCPCAGALRSPMAWLLAVLALAVLWNLVGRGFARVLGEDRRRWGVDLGPLPIVIEQWSLGLGVLAAGPLVVHVVSTTLAVAGGAPVALFEVGAEAWWEGVLALLLLGVFAELAGRDVDAAWARLIPHATLTLLVWWAVLPPAPTLRAMRLDPAAALPLATALQAMAAAALSRRPDLAGRRIGRFGPHDPRRAEESAAAVGWYAFGLALVAVGLTGGRIWPWTSATLLVATAVMATLAGAGRRAVTARVGAVLWMLAWASLALDLAGREGWERWPVVATAIAVSQLVAAALLAVLAGRLRRRAIEVAGLIEPFAVAGALLAAALAGASLLDSIGVGEVQALANMGVFLGAGALFTVLAQRRGSAVLAFAAQGAILAGYVAYRAGFPLPGASDAVVVLLLAALDLGAAEVLDRLRRPLFARPAMGAALVLPLASLALALRGGLLRDEALFILCATATFYAAICGRLGWRVPGYAAAVLYNAFLWALWARAGWALADDPQFYVIPVGLTAILFVEVHRRELGRPGVNAIRGLGLSLIYLSLTVPIWRAASVAAWAALLFVSLAGVFVGIGLRSQVFLWLGLAGFVMDVVYQLGRIGTEHSGAKWAIMFALGTALFLFAALSEKKRFVEAMRGYVEQIRQWD